MENEKHKRSELADKIIAGIQFAHEKLLEEAIKNDDYLVISHKGKIVRMKAKKIKEQLEKERISKLKQ